MKTETEIVITTRQGAQGDVLLTRKPKRFKIPTSFVAVPRTGDIVVTHSETGHHHVIRDDGVVMLTDPADPFVCYLRVDGDGCSLEHLRDYATHWTHRLTGPPGTIWEVRRQREYTPEGLRRVED